MGEIITPLIVIEQGETYTADEDGAVVITGEHTHSDILRHVVSDIGSDARSLLEEITRESATQTSYVKNCFIKVRKDETNAHLIFADDKGNVVVKLDGYAIVPLDEWKRLSE